MTSRFARVRRNTVPFASTIAVLSAFGIFAFVLPGGAIGSPPASETRNGDLTAFGRHLLISEPVAGNVQVLGGSLTVDAPINGRVVVIGGDVVIRNGRIDGDLVCIGGQVAWEDRSSVRGDVYAPRNGYASVKAGELMVASMREPFSLLTIALELSLLLFWLIVSIVLTLTNGREIRASSLEVRASPLHSFLLGLVAFTSFVLSAIVFSYLIPIFVGTVLLAALLVFAVVAKVYGMVAVFHAVGEMIAGPRSHQELERRRWIRGDLAKVVVGFLVLGLLRLIPFVGPVVWMTASALAVGAALSTRFGRREPWFLTWRPAEA